MFHFFGFLWFRVDFPSQKLHNFLVFHFSKNAFSVFTPLAIPRERVLTRFRKCFIFGDFASPNCSESPVINGDFVSIFLCSQLFWTRSLSFLQGKIDTESSFFSWWCSTFQISACWGVKKLLNFSVFENYCQSNIALKNMFKCGAFSIIYLW